MAKDNEINCSNCGMRNPPSCYGTCEIYLRRKEREAAIKKAMQPSPAQQYGMDNAKRTLNRAAKKKRK